MVNTLLAVENVTVSFSGFKALDNLNFNVVAGGVKVIIGPNGAGKSTLLDTVIGKVRPTSGRVIYKGTDITGMSEHKIAQMGIRRKFQAPGILPGLSVNDNVAVAVQKSKGLLSNLGSGLRPRERERVDSVLQVTGLTGKRNMLAAHLAHGEKQWLEIGMVVASEPELVMLDEPTAGMTDAETFQTAQLIRQLSEALTVLVIDHDMTFVEQLGGAISVLHMGKLLKEGNIQEIRNDPDVISVYLGRSQSQSHAFA